MIGLGTLINIGAILLGGLLGIVCGKAMNSSLQDSLMKATGLCVMFIGIGGSMEKMLTISGGSLTSSGAMMIVGSFAAGTLLGEALRIEYRIEQFGEWLKIKSGSSGEHTFVAGFVTASLTVCVGAMAIVGSIQDGIAGDYSVLMLKAVLDLLIIWVMTASMGKGCIFAAIPVAVLQGSVTLLARALEPMVTDQALANIALAGSMLIFCVGVNLIWERTLKVANMLPALVIAALWSFF